MMKTLLIKLGTCALAAHSWCLTPGGWFTT